MHHCVSGKFGQLVELHQEWIATKGATLSSFLTLLNISCTLKRKPCKKCVKKSHIQETLNRSTDADSSTDNFFFASPTTFFGEEVKNILFEGGGVFFIIFL